MARRLRAPRRPAAPSSALRGAATAELARSGELAHLDDLLDQLARDRTAGPPPREVSTASRSPMLDRLAAGFGLSGFETDLVALALAVDVDPGNRHLVGSLDVDARNRHPSIVFAVELLHDDALDDHWHAALDAEAPLRRFRLIEVGGDGPLPTQVLRLHRDLDRRWWQRTIAPALAPARADLAEMIAACVRWASSIAAPIILVHGIAGGTGRDAGARAIASASGRGVVEWARRRRAARRNPRRALDRRVAARRRE